MSALPEIGDPVPGPDIYGDSGARRVLQRVAGLQRDYPIAQVVALVAIFIYGRSSLEGFGSKQSIYAMLILATLLGLAAAGQTVVLLIGGIDFSIPAFIVGGATLMVQLTGTKGWSFGPALILIIVLSATIGGVSGYLSHRFRVQPLIVTLAVGSIVLGGILVWAQGLVTGTAPAWLSTFTSPATKTFGLDFPPLVVLWAVVAIVIGVVLHRTVAGRWIYATGSNPRAADLALVPTRRVWTLTFAFSAFMAAMVGILLAGFSGSGDSSDRRSVPVPVADRGRHRRDRVRRARRLLAHRPRHADPDRADDGAHRRRRDVRDPADPVRRPDPRRRRALRTRAPRTRPSLRSTSMTFVVDHQAHWYPEGPPRGPVR